MNSNEDELIQPWMYRVQGENIAFITTLVILLGLGLLLSWVNLYLLLAVLLGVLIYVKLSQAKLKGDAIRVHSEQFGNIYETFINFAKKLGIERASLYITQDPYLNAYTLGINTCTVVLNSALVEQLSKNELAFVIAHELGHYAAGHTKLSTLFIPLGGNMISDLIFGVWTRMTEYTCDRCGLALTKDLDSTTSAMLKIAVGGKLFEKISLEGYTSQLNDAQQTSVKVGELLGSHPLVSNRILHAISFWKENFVENK